MRRSMGSRTTTGHQPRTGSGARQYRLKHSLRSDTQESSTHSCLSVAGLKLAPPPVPCQRLAIENPPALNHGRCPSEHNPPADQGLASRASPTSDFTRHPDPHRIDARPSPPSRHHRRRIPTPGSRPPPHPPPSAFAGPTGPAPTGTAFGPLRSTKIPRSVSHRAPTRPA